MIYCNNEDCDFCDSLEEKCTKEDIQLKVVYESPTAVCISDSNYEDDEEM